MPLLAVMADIRTGLPGGADERDGGDAAVAFLFSGAMFDSPRDRRGRRRRRARRTSSSTAGACPVKTASHVWEERFGEHAYVPLAEIAINDALKSAGVTPSELDHVIVTGAARACGEAGRRRRSALAPRRSSTTSRASSATPARRTPACCSPTCSTAPSPGRSILRCTLADGADAVVLRTTDELVAYRERRATTVAEQIAAGRDDLGYQTYLTWRGFLAA